MSSSNNVDIEELSITAGDKRRTRSYEQACHFARDYAELMQPTCSYYPVLNFNKLKSRCPIGWLPKIGYQFIQEQDHFQQELYRESVQNKIPAWNCDQTGHGCEEKTSEELQEF